MSKVETLTKNIQVIRTAENSFDYSAIDPKDAIAIKKGLEYVAGLCQVYIDFENSGNPDK